MNIQSHPFSIAICDDEPGMLETAASMAERVCKQEGIDSDIFCFDSGTKLIESIENGRLFDVLLLDVIMPEQNGIELAQLLRKERFDGSIIFISSNKEMALHGYEVSAARYLAKPVDEEHMREALLYCFGKTQSSKELLIPVNGGTLRLLPEEIMYIETQGRGCHIVSEHDECVTVMRISEFESKLAANGFVRCHQGFLVNMRFIRVVRATELELMNEFRIPVSKHRIQNVRKQFFAWMEK